MRHTQKKKLEPQAGDLVSFFLLCNDKLQSVYHLNSFVSALFNNQVYLVSSHNELLPILTLLN